METTPEQQDPPPPLPFMGATPHVVPQSHAERVFDLDFNPACSMLASASEDGDVRLWSLASSHDNVPALLQVLPHEAEVLRVAWGPWPSLSSSSSSPSLATGTATGRVRLYSVAAPPSLSSDETRASSAAPDDVATLVTEFDHPKEGQQVYALRWMDSAVDEGGPGRILLTAADDKVYMWDVETQKVSGEWEFVQQSPGEAFGGGNRNPDGACYVFDVALGRLQPDQPHDVVCLALSDGSVRIHDPRSGQAVAALRREGTVGGHLTALHLGTEDGVLLACGGRGEVAVYDTRTFGVRTVLDAHKRPCFGAKVVPRALVTQHFSTTSSGGPVILTWGADTTLRLFDLNATTEASSALLQVVHHPSFPIYTCAFGTDEGTHNGWHLYVGGGEGLQAEPHEHDHDHNDHHHHEHGDEGSCCSHHQHETAAGKEAGEEEEEEGRREKDEVEEVETPPSLLYYKF